MRTSQGVVKYDSGMAHLHIEELDCEVRRRDTVLRGTAALIVLRKTAVVI
jgi:hypothetical protein